MFESKRILVFAALVVALFCFSVSVSAQRQTPGRWSLEAYGTVGSNGIYSGIIGGGARAEVYGFRHRTIYGIDVCSSPREYTIPELVSEDDPSLIIAPADRRVMTSLDATAVFGYLFRIASTRSRWLVFSGGATAGLGLSNCKELGTISPYYDGEYLKQNGFLLYLRPELELEVFPFKSASFYISARPKVTILNTLSGSTPWFQFNSAFGVKVYI